MIVTEPVVFLLIKVTSCFTCLFLKLLFPLSEAGLNVKSLFCMCCGSLCVLCGSEV